MASKRVLEVVRETGNIAARGAFHKRGLWAYIGAANGYRLDTVPEGNPVRAWRAWSCNSNGQLCSLTKNWPWKQEHRPSSCLSSITRDHLRKLSWGEGVEELGDHGDSPCPECGCGYWAFREPLGNSMVLSQLRSWSRNHGSFFVTGEVALWGNVVSHDAGFRAQFARPVGELVVEPNSDYSGAVREFLVDQMERRYDVPVKAKPF